MTYRAIILVPEGLTFDMLPQEQQDAINSVFGRHVNPMPGSIPAEGSQLVDALTKDNFDPETMPSYGITWPVLSLTHWDGESANTDIITPLNVAEFIKFMPDGTVTECHRWAGWPDGGFTAAFNGEFKK